MPESGVLGHLIRQPKADTLFKGILSLEQLYRYGLNVRRKFKPTTRGEGLKGKFINSVSRGLRESYVSAKGLMDPEEATGNSHRLQFEWYRG